VAIHDPRKRRLVPGSRSPQKLGVGRFLQSLSIRFY